MRDKDQTAPHTNRRDGREIGGGPDLVNCRGRACPRPRETSSWPPFGHCRVLKIARLSGAVCGRRTIATKDRAMTSHSSSARSAATPAAARPPGRVLGLTLALALQVVLAAPAAAQN